MDSHTTRQVPGQAQVAPVVTLRALSKWYGNVIGVNDLTLEIRPGVTGLLGPNGAGKSTLLQVLTGQLRPSRGEVTVLGERPWDNARLNRRIGVCPEQDVFWEWMSGWQFVYSLARLSGLSRNEARDASGATLELVGMTEHMHRAVRGYSKGMRQRTKLAQALVHDPEIVFLDEPLAGTDPVARRALADLIVELGQRGKSVLVSSHVLYEVESITPQVVVLNRGRLLAEGHVREIRDLIDKHPHRIVLVSENYRQLAAKAVAFDDVAGVTIMPDDRAVLVETNKPDAFYARLPALSLEDGTAIDEVYSEDDNLESVFNYLVKG